MLLTSNLHSKGTAREQEVRMGLTTSGPPPSDSPSAAKIHLFRFYTVPEPPGAYQEGLTFGSQLYHICVVAKEE